MDQSLVHTFSWGNSYGPMVLKVLQKFPPTLVLVHGWLFPVGSSELPEKGPENGCRATIAEKCRRLFLTHFGEFDVFFKMFALYKKYPKPSQNLKIDVARKLPKNVDNYSGHFWRF